MKNLVMILPALAGASLFAQIPPSPDRNRPGPWDNDVLVYRVEASGELKALATFERAGVPTVARMKDGRLIAAFQTFPQDDDRNFDRVAVRFSSDDGQTWTKPEPIVVEGMEAGLARPFDPTLVPLPDGRVRLYFTSNRSPDFRRSTPQIFSSISTNGLHYTFEPGVRFGIEDRIVIDCAVALHEGVFHLIVPDNGAAGDFMARPQRGQQPMGGSGYHAVSKDGLKFERVADVKLSSARDRWLGNMQSDGGKLVFFGTGPGPWPVTSPDGASWQSATATTRVPGADPGAVKLRDGSWLLLVTGEPRPGTPSALQRGNRRGPFPGEPPGPRGNPRPPNEGGLMRPPGAPDRPPGLENPPSASGGLRSHHVHSATSADGLNWTRDEGVRVASASVPCAINDGDRRVLLYFVKPPSQPGQPETVACAVSTDGLKFDLAPEFRIEGLSSIKAVDPSILKDGEGKFRLYYLASNHRGDPASGENPHPINFALSDDGIHFREAGTAFSYDNLVDPDVFRFKDRWFMYVFAGRGTAIATSADGMDFKFLRNMTPRDWGTTAAVPLPDGRLRLYAFEQRVPIGNAVGSFLSTNGLDWIAEPGVRLQAGPDEQITDPFVIPWRGGWKMYFKTSPARSPGGARPQGPNRRAERTDGPEAEPAAVKPRLIRVNASETTGRIRSLLGVNRGPLAWPREPGGKTTSLVESYRRFGIDFIRTHDFYGPTDWHVIFPRWDADAGAAASYDFRSSDERIRAIADNGFGCFFRLGTSWKGRRLEPINDPPGTKRDAAGRITHVADRDDFKKWAAICAQTVRHYTEGWNNGFKFPIEYWEIWNEPDLAAQFWTGTPEQYYALYEEAARAVKAVNPKLKVGGPACTGGLREAYVERFIRYCAERKVPLDFFSWHSYGGRDEFNPYQFRRDAERIRRALDDAGFAQTENIITEWNAGIQQRLFSDTPRGAAFYASTLACLLDAGVDRAFQYCGDQHPGLGLHEMGTGQPKICAFAFAAWKQLLETPERLSATGSDERGYNVVAGKSADGRRVQVLISDFQSSDRAFRLRVEKLPWTADARVSVKRWLLDADHRFTVVEESSASGNDLTLERPFRSESVCLVELEAVSPKTVAAPPSRAAEMQPSLPFPIVDTGQTTCYDSRGEVASPKLGQPFYGQDAQHQGRAASYTLSADGLTVRDNVTGLTWQRSPDTDGNGVLERADKLTFPQAQALPARLNSAKFGGFDDWRLPTIKELYSLFDGRGTDPSGPMDAETSRLRPFLDTNFFRFVYGNVTGERVIDSQYASSTKYVGKGARGFDKLFGVNFADGRIKGYDLFMPGGRAGKTFFVICVRGNPGYGTNDFHDNADGTITDRATGLMWSKADSGRGMNWHDALAWVQQKNAEKYLGHDDWRLPDVKELQSIVDYSRSPDTSRSPAIDPAFVCSAITNEAKQVDWPFYWSSTTHSGMRGGAAAMYVAFGRSAGWMSPRALAGGPPERRGGFGGPPGAGDRGGATGEYNYVDVHGAGSQRSDPKAGDPAMFPHGRGPQGDVIRIYNFVRPVRGGMAP